MTASQFDPMRIRDRLVGACGYEWSLAADFTESRQVGGLGGTADANLGKAIQCLLVGFDEPAERLLQKAVEWARVAIETNEQPQRYFPGATEASCFESLALCHWFLTNKHDTESFQKFVEHKDTWLNSQRRKDKIGVSLTLVTYVDAGAFRRALDIFDSTPGLSAPTSLRPRNEAEMSYILCRHHLGLQYSDEDVREVTMKFLNANMNKWLSNGNWVRAAEWLKVIHWNNVSEPIPAKQILMKAYDYLPVTA